MLLDTTAHNYFIVSLRLFEILLENSLQLTWSFKLFGFCNASELFYGEHEITLFSFEKKIS
jgi:hypothetical protein